MPLGALEVGPMRSYIVKEIHIGSAVNEILWYTQTNILLLFKKEDKFLQLHYNNRHLQTVSALELSKLVWSSYHTDIGGMTWTLDTLSTFSRIISRKYVCKQHTEKLRC